jgi:RNA polymerase sigma factor (sigma-70 family)
MNAPGDHREEGFRSLYAAHFDAVLGYALRRAPRVEDAADVTAETFLVAWRRIAHVPLGDSTRPWLYAVARRQLANQRRGELRRRRLGERLRSDLRLVVPDISDQVVQDHVVDAAMARLSARDEEVLQLHLWEGLESREIGEVLGLPASVVRPRLSRARARLRDLLGNDPPPAGHIPGKQPIPIREEE